MEEAAGTISSMEIFNPTKSRLWYVSGFCATIEKVHTIIIKDNLTIIFKFCGFFYNLGMCCEYGFRQKLIPK